MTNHRMSHSKQTNPFTNVTYDEFTSSFPGERSHWQTDEKEFFDDSLRIRFVNNCA